MCKSVKRLSCGSTDECCHVAYAHRHCEHCNAVLATYQPVWYWPTQPQPNYNPWWLHQTGMNTADRVTLRLTDTGAAGGAAFNNTTFCAGNIPALPDHACAAEP